MVKFALIGNGPLTNRGCEAIVLGTNRILEREFGPAEFLLASFAEDPRVSVPANMYPVALPYKRPRWSKAWWQYRIGRLLGKPEDKTGVLRSLKSQLGHVMAALSIGGDGYAIDYGHLIVDRLVIIDNYVRSQGIPVIIWGASIGPFDKEPEFERRMAEHFAGVNLIVVREPASLGYLKGLGVTENVYLAPDPAFALESKVCYLPDEVERFLAQPCMGVNLSPLLARYATEGDLARWIKLAADILGRLLADIGLPILMIPHVTTTDHNLSMDDYLFLLEVFSAMSPVQQEQVVIAPPDLNSENLKWVISRTSVFIGARAHAIMAALSSCVPCLSIAYSIKAWGINDLVWEHRDWVFSFKDSDPWQLCDSVVNLVNEREQSRIYLQTVIPELISKSYDAAKQVRLVISAKGGL